MARLSASDAHLWLWVTNGTLPMGREVMAAWGFSYRSCLTCGYVDECWQGSALGLIDPRAGPERRREPSHGNLAL